MSSILRIRIKFSQNISNFSIVTQKAKETTFISHSHKASRGAAAQSVTVKATGCGFDPQSGK